MDRLRTYPKGCIGCYKIRDLTFSFGFLFLFIYRYSADQARTDMKIGENKKVTIVELKMSGGEGKRIFYGAIIRYVNGKVGIYSFEDKSSFIFSDRNIEAIWYNQDLPIRN